MKKAVEIQLESQAFVSMIVRVTPETYEKAFGSPEMMEGFREFHDKELKERIERDNNAKAVIKTKVFIREIEVEDGEELM